MKFYAFTLMIILIVASNPIFSQTINLGSVPTKGTAKVFPKSRASSSGLVIDRTQKSEVAKFYKSYYKKFIGSVNSWTGSVSGCKSGNNSSAYDTATLELLKYYRAMAGLPADVSFSEEYNKFARDAALIMEAKNDLNHNPPSNWPCYSESGKKGASSSNLCLGCVGPTAIDAYVDDRGVSGVGHRNWVFLPQQKVLGTGSSKRAHALYVFGDWKSNDDVAKIKEVAWPPAGNVPSEFGLDSGYPWSYTTFASNVDLSNARMNLSQNGKKISVRVDTTQKGALVVYPTGLPQGNHSNQYNREIAGDGYTIDVQIQNAKIDGKLQDIKYSVTFIDAQREFKKEEAIDDTNVVDENPTIEIKPEDKKRFTEEFLLACYEGQKDEVIRLLERGADINGDYKGWTGLMYAANFGHLEIVEILLKKHADIKKENQGWTAGDFARSSGYTKIADMLQPNKADRSLPQGKMPGLP